MGKPNDHLHQRGHVEHHVEFNDQRQIEAAKNKQKQSLEHYHSACSIDNKDIVAIVCNELEQWRLKMTLALFQCCTKKTGKCTKKFRAT